MKYLEALYRRGSWYYLRKFGCPRLCPGEELDFLARGCLGLAVEPYHQLWISILETCPRCVWILWDSLRVNRYFGRSATLRCSL